MCSHQSRGVYRPPLQPHAKKNYQVASLFRRARGTEPPLQAPAPSQPSRFRFFVARRPAGARASDRSRWRGNCFGGGFCCHRAAEDAFDGSGSSGSITASTTSTAASSDRCSNSNQYMQLFPRRRGRERGREGAEERATTARWWSCRHGDGTCDNVRESGSGGGSDGGVGRQGGGRGIPASASAATATAQTAIGAGRARGRGRRLPQQGGRSTVGAVLSCEQVQYTVLYLPKCILHMRLLKFRTGAE